MRDLQHANDLAAHALDAKGYDGSQLQTEIEAVPESTGPVTMKHLRARVNVLATCTTTNGKFAVTGGSHLNTNDIFKSVKVEALQDQIKKLHQEKKKQLAYNSFSNSSSSPVDMVCIDTRSSLF